MTIRSKHRHTAHSRRTSRCSPTAAHVVFPRHSAQRGPRRLSLVVRGQERMAFHTADYDAYVVLGDPAAAPLWRWKVWQRFLPAIDPVIHAARGKPAVRSIQYLPDQAGVVKFGRLGWKEAD